MCQEGLPVSWLLFVGGLFGYRVSICDGVLLADICCPLRHAAYCCVRVTAGCGPPSAVDVMAVIVVATRRAKLITSNSEEETAQT